jgi:hypothetical protein
MDAASMNIHTSKLPSKYLEERKACFLTGAEDMQHLVTIPNFPVGMYCVHRDSPDVEWFTDMTWMISKSTGAIQLSHLIDPSILYDSQHESGALGGLWKRHHDAFCNFVESSGLKNFLEIGGGHGNLARLFTARNVDTKWIVVEPNLPSSFLKEADSSSQIIPVQGWFDQNFKLPEGFAQVDAVIHSHTFEHIYHYDVFLESISRLKPKFQIFSVPFQKEWLRRGWQNSIMFEHPQLLTPSAIEFLLQRHGYVLSEKVVFGDSHSLFYSFSRATDREAKIPIPPAPSEFEENKDLFMSWLHSNSEFVRSINDKMENHLNEHIFVFGAHIFTQYLNCLGLNSNKVVGILDNAASKQGKRLYGLPQLVSSPEVLSGLQRPAVILRVGAYASEIKKDILEINPSVIFWE